MRKAGHLFEWKPQRLGVCWDVYGETEASKSLAGLWGFEGNSGPKFEKMCSGRVGGGQHGLCHLSSFVPESV